MRMVVPAVTVTDVNIRYTWSRFSANPVEHVAQDDEFGQPLCGTFLSLGYQHFEDLPSGLAPLCQRCESKKKKLGSATCP